MLLFYIYTMMHSQNYRSFYGITMKLIDCVYSPDLSHR